jgi:hypothetical protein
MIEASYHNSNIYSIVGCRAIELQNQDLPTLKHDTDCMVLEYYVSVFNDLTTETLEGGNYLL